MADSLITKMQKRAIREEILHRWDIKIPAARATKLSLAQLVAIRAALMGPQKGTFNGSQAIDSQNP